MTLKEIQSAVRLLAMYDPFWKERYMNLYESDGWEWFAAKVNAANCKNGNDIDAWYKSCMMAS